MNTLYYIQYYIFMYVFFFFSRFHKLNNLPCKLDCAYNFLYKEIRAVYFSRE